MIRLAVLGLVFLSGVFAQQTSMASSSDGAILHFSSRLALKTEPPALNSYRIYLHGPTPTVLLSQLPGAEISYPYLSSDARTTATFAYQPCFGSCMFAVPRDRLYLNRNGSEEIFYGNQFRVSRNGRFVFDSGFPNLHRGPYLKDVDTGKEVAFPKVLTRHQRNTISDDGALLSTEPGALAGIGDPSEYDKVLLTPFAQPSRVLFEGARVPQAAITPDGRTVFLLTRSPSRLIAIDTATNEQSILLDAADTVWVGNPSRDGNRLLVMRRNELLLWDRATGWRSLLSHDEEFIEALLSDNGAVAFAMTTKGRYFRIAVDSGEAIQLYSAIPDSLSQRTFGAYAGSMVRLMARGVTPDTRFTIGGMPMPITRIEPDFVDVQIPWEHSGTTNLVEATTLESPFAVRTRISLTNRPSPWIFTTYFPRESINVISAATEDFSSLISPSNPARAGSLIHFWVTGLGPLDQPLATGEKGPSNPAARPLAPIACYLTTTSEPRMVVGLRLPTVIYAPNLVGVYQIDAEIPANWPSGISMVSCNGEGPFSTGAEIPIRALP